MNTLPASAPETACRIDQSKNAKPRNLLPNSAGNNQLLYFTSASLTADDRHLVFISDRTGDPNLFTIDLQTGEERQLSRNTEGFLKSYVYFNGRPYGGFGKASVSLDIHNGTIYYIQGQAICAVNLQGEHRVLARYPKGQMTAYTHVSADGARLCVPTIDARALDGDTVLNGAPSYSIDDRVIDENLSSYLREYDTRTGEELSCERVRGGWITHVQYSPLDSSAILYNNEWTRRESGFRRLWLWNGKTHTRLRTAGEGRDSQDEVTHEMWDRDARSIVYHGCFNRTSPEHDNKPQFVGMVTPDGRKMIELSLPRAWKRYGHYTVGKPGELVTDGYYQEAGDEQHERSVNGGMRGGQWISYLRPDWEHNRLDWFPLCRHGSSWRDQDAHPHPVFNHAASAILYNSDAGGRRSIYQVEAGK